MFCQIHVSPIKVNVAFYGAPVLYHRGSFIFIGGLIGPGNSVADIKGLDAKSHSWSHLGNLKARVDIYRYSRVHSCYITRSN